MMLLRNYVIFLRLLLLQLLLVKGSHGQENTSNSKSQPELQCPRSCKCSNPAEKPTPFPMPIVICSGVNLTSIPAGIPTAAKKLDLSGNNITRIGPTQLVKLKSLEELNLKSNLIEEVDSSALTTLTGLKELSLSRNKLRRFPTSAIQSQIQILNLEYNNIGSLGANILKNNSRMRWLFLGNNRIDKIDEEAFTGLAQLQFLELNDNRLTEVPSALMRLGNLQELSLANNRITRIDVPFHEIAPRVVLLQLRGNPMHYIHPEGFSHLPQLKKLILSDVKNLTEFPHLNGTTSLEILRIDRCSLRYVPTDLCHFTPKLKSLDLKSNKLHDMPVLEGCSELKILDLSMNEIEDLGERTFQNSSDLHDLHLSHNRMNKIPADAFHGLSHLRNLDLSYNIIDEIHPQAFVPTLELSDLNLGNNLFPVLPSEGLSQVFELKMFNNPNLREFPGPESFPRVRRLVLSYAYHCCQFTPYAGSSSPESTIQDKVWYPTDNEFGSALSAFNLTESWSSIVNMSSNRELANDFWNSFGTAVTTEATNLDEFGGDEIFMAKGRFSGNRQQIQCIPLPGPFLPCNDLFDWWTLRCGVWVVFLLALMGNGTVVFVLIFARTKMDVPRFLVCNLAIADFFMGVYLGFLAVVDAATLGDFRKFAIPWQLSTGCQMAGFLGVLSSELSVYTLAVITMERHYAITHAMHLNKRLSLRHATYIMILGWIFALLMAVLPLFGVSDYRKFAVCLPFETGDGVSMGYVVFLMFANGVAFTILMGCYLKMYCSIRGSQAWNSNDTRIAKRMALLVFTDLLCWFPIAFFSLTAVFGLQLVSLEEAKVFTVFVLPLNSCCNPFLYAILTKQFKKDCVLICKAIEESRVTRGIGRCRHSSNFSNRQTAANTGSLVEKSSKDGQPCICHSGLHPAGGDVNGNAKYRFVPAPERWSRYGVLGRFFSRYILCQQNSKEANRQARDDYRMRNVRRYLYNSATTNYPADAQKHQRHPSVSSDNFSSSRSDSWRVQGRCGIPLRLLEPRRRNSWAVTRKPSQDSNLSSSRNDSSATSNSTATWRLSRSSVSSDAASHSGGGRSSFKKISTNTAAAAAANAVAINVVNRGKIIEATQRQAPPNAPGTSQGNVINPAVINEEEVISVSPTPLQPQVLLTQALPQRKGSTPKLETIKQKKSGKNKKSVNVKKVRRNKNNSDIMTIIDDEEASAKIATNRPRLVRQSAFFSEEVVIEPEICPVHGPLIPGTYDDDNDEENNVSDIDEEDDDDDDEEEDEDEDEEADQVGNDPTSPILRKASNQIGIALVIVPRRLSTISSRDTMSIRSREDNNESLYPSTSGTNNIPVPGSSSASSSPTALLLPGGSAAAAFGRRKMSEQPVKFYVVPATPGLINSAKWHSMSSVEIINSPQTQPQVHYTSAQSQSRSQSPRESQSHNRVEDERMSSMIEIEDDDSVSEQMDSVGRFGGHSSGSSRDPNERRVSFQLPAKNSPENRPDTS